MKNKNISFTLTQAAMIAAIMWCSLICIRTIFIRRGTGSVFQRP